ncbi:hypothetical protein BDV93DRAFT_544630 [Ceratobasidium sp. AG-I]|nr:hypothetical protein BDV93DRAFT_544630 [Ceratobasidium sp. AG-I]
MVYNAVFITYFLLSSFTKIGEKERLSVELVVNLAASYDLSNDRIPMTRDAYAKARVFQPQLCKLAGRYGSVRIDMEMSYIDAHSMLFSIVKPLVAHLCPYEHDKVRTSLNEAHQLLDLPLSKLRPAVEFWFSNNFEMALQTTPLPRSSHSRVFNERQARSLPRKSRSGARRHGWNPIHAFNPTTTREEYSPRAEKVNFRPVQTGSLRGEPEPWWVDRPTQGRALGVRTGQGKEWQASRWNIRESWSAQELAITSPVSSMGPFTPRTDESANPEYWNDRTGYGHGSCWEDSIGSGKEMETSMKVGQKLADQMRKGFKAMFSAS